MYHNIGGKIKGLAIVVFIIEAIGAFITGIILWVDWEEWWCALIVFGGPVFAWISSWMVYAFGQLVEDTHAMREKQETISEIKARLEAEDRERWQTEKKDEFEAEEESARAEEYDDEHNGKEEDENASDDMECLTCKKIFSVPRSQNVVMCPWCYTKYKVY